MWTDGNGSALTDPCGDSNLLQTHICVPGQMATWGVFTWTGTWDGEPLRVVVQSGYQLAGSGWQEERLLSSDQADDAQGCDQLAVLITQNRSPGSEASQPRPTWSPLSARVERSSRDPAATPLPCFC